jgi:uncharacterized membrane protein
VALTALAFAGYLLYVQLFVLDALCSWCVENDALVTTAAALAIARLRPPPASG